MIGLLLLLASTASLTPPCCAPAAVPGDARLALPAPSADPLEDAGSADAVLALEGDGRGSAGFLDMVHSSIARHPALAETRADEEAARAGRRVARSGLFPTIDAGLNFDHAIARQFGNNINTIVEQSRLDGRTDVSVAASQTLLDFGATSRSIRAANSRIKGAEAQTLDTEQNVAFLAIQAYYDLYLFQREAELAASFQERQAQIRRAVEDHVSQGTSARGDLSRIDASVFRINAQLANFQRRLADAQARWGELSGLPVPAAVHRPEPAQTLAMTRDAAVAGAGALPSVRAADMVAQAARYDAGSQHARMLPQVTATVNFGRYGVFEGLSDYDARAQVSLRQRFLGGLAARADQASAQARAAEARADRTREEAERDAAIAWSDLGALEAQLAAQRSSYVSARRVRDVEAERFRVERGTLVDLLDAEETYYGVATNYISVLAQRDVARFALLMKSGKLDQALELASDDGRGAAGRSQ